MANFFDQYDSDGAADAGSSGNFFDQYDPPSGAKPPKSPGLIGTVVEGAKSAVRSVGATVDAYTGDGPGIVKAAEAQQAAPKAESLTRFYEGVEKRTEPLGDDPGVWDSVKAVGGAIADNPGGAGLALAEQLPNAAVSLGAGWAGMKAGGAGGAALGSVVPGVGTAVGGAVGAVTGGLAGLFLGNTALETGQKAMEAADDGIVTDEEMSGARREGVIKGGVITAVDAATLGAGGLVNKAMLRPAQKAMETATAKVLADRGIDIADQAAVLAARSNPEIATAVTAAQRKALTAADRMGNKLVRGGTVLSMETVGEGLGEYLGELAATGEGDIPDAVLESFLGLGQSAAQTAWTAARGKAKVQPMPTPENPNPEPVDAPDPAAGALSKAASLLPAVETPAPVLDTALLDAETIQQQAAATPEPALLALPAPNSMYVDREGNAQPVAPMRDDTIRQPRLGQDGLSAVIQSGERPNTVPAEEQRRIDRLAVADLEQERADRVAAAYVSRANVAANEALAREETPSTYAIPKGLELSDPKGHGRWFSDFYRNSVDGLVSQLTPGGDVAYVRNANDVITGRTPSINPKWWQNMDAGAKPSSIAQAQAIVTKALEGKPLGPKQARFITAMMDMADEMNADPQRAAQNEAILQEIEYASRGEALRNQADYQRGASRHEVSAQDDAELFAYLDGQVEPFSMDDLTPADIESISRDLIALDDTSEQTRMAGETNDGESNADIATAVQTRSQVLAQQRVQGQRRSDTQDGAAVPLGESALLASYTETELADLERAQTKGRQVFEAARLRDAQRASVDADRNDFSLTGSNRTVDVAEGAGQADLLARSQAPDVPNPPNSSRESPDNTDDRALFQRRRAAPVSFISRADIEKLAVRKMGKSTAANRFRFVDYAELPAQIKKAATDQGASPDEVRAVHWRGMTYMVDGRFATEAEAAGAMFHEHYVHFGLRAKYGKGLRMKLGGLLSGVGGLKGVRELSAKQNIDLTDYARGMASDTTISSEDRGLVLMEELMAHMAETTGTLRRTVEEFVGMVRAWLRNNGYADLSRLGVTDLAFELRVARQAAIDADATPALGAGLPMFQRVMGAVDTDAFKRWFGDSKVVDEQGRPLVVYHGTTREFTSFERKSSGDMSGYFAAPYPEGAAPFAGMNQSEASRGDGGRIMPLYMSIQNAASYRDLRVAIRATDGAPPSVTRHLEEKGFDGYMDENEVVAFRSEQIKSAIGNNGNFDPDNADIRFRRAGITGRARDAIDRSMGKREPDPNDPFAEENRRLREDDNALWTKAKKVFQRQLAPGGLLPKDVFSEKITRDSEFQAVEFDVRHMVGTLDKAIRADYGVKTDELAPVQMKRLGEALAGRVDPAIPENTKVAIVAMRQYIDSLSGEYVGILQQQVRDNLAGADPGMIETIAGNMGSYVHRSYQAFDDPKWFKQVPTETVNAARQYLISGYQAQGETVAESRRLADVTVNEMLKNGTAYDSMESFIAEGKLGAKDLSVMIKRKEIAPEIRALLGEYIDPRLNFAKSATKMGRLIWNQRFLDRVRDVGMGSFLFEGKNRPADATTQIAGEQSDSYAPLNGLWTFPEVAQAFKDSLGKEQMSDLYRTIVRANGLVKYGKTVLSPTTAMRNWQSALFFSLANGHFDLTQMSKSWAAFREQVSQSATGDDLVYLRKLKQLGVVYDTPYAGEMQRLMEDARIDDMLTGKAAGQFGWFRQANQMAQGFYSFGDDFWKIIGFENEKANLLKAGIPVAQVEKMAAERIRNTYPTYSMVGKSVRWLSRFPLAGTFVSFPAEIVRTSANMLKLTASDLKSDNPAMRSIGRKRVAGMAMVSAGFYALSAMTAAALGVDDDEEEALRDLAPEWQKNSTFLYHGRDANGMLRYFDMSFLDPYGYWKRPITAMMRDQPWEKSAAEAIGDMVSPFFGADMTAEAIFQVLANKKGTGGQVYQENGDAVDQLSSIADHMRKALQPGFVGNAERLWLAANDQRREGSGQPFEMRDELVSLLGWRASTLDAKTGLYYRAFEFTDGLSDARRTLNRTLRSANNVSDKDIASAKAAAQRQQEQAFRQMSRLVSSAQSMGMSRTQIIQTLRQSNISQANIAGLLNGQPPPLRITPQSRMKAISQARAMQGQEQAMEVARRFAVAASMP